MKKQLGNTHAMILATGFSALFMLGQASVLAQQPLPDELGTDMTEPGMEAQSSDSVTINVKNANIAEVLKAYSLQTGQSIVVGPDVVSDNVNVRLNNIPWQDALDVILKPYGFGYRVVGDTIVISKLENIVTVEGIEPLASKVFSLKYLDAYDIKDVCEAQLTSRGKFTILAARGQTGWEFGGMGTGGAATEAGLRQRKKASGEEFKKSKMFVITDVPASLSALEDIIETLDVPPSQILIESRFLEIKTGGLSDIGMDYLGGIENVVEQSLTVGSSGNNLQPSALAELNKVLNLTTGFVDPLNTRAAGSISQTDGLRLSHAEIGDAGMELIFALMASDDDVNILSAPHILTLNNQEAAILVGQKYPIIQSQSNTGGGGTTTSTSLDYYENIGIQLNVVPQLCADDQVSMIVHPAVSEIANFASGVVFSGGGDSASGTQYPIMDIREAETQIMIKSGNTAVIGGLQSERDQEYVQKVPFLGDIPFLGRLFRRETMTKQKTDLLIFLKATVIDNEPYAQTSAETQQTREAGMRLDLVKPAMDDQVEASAEDVEMEAAPAEAEEMNPAPAESKEMEPAAVEEDQSMEQEAAASDSEGQELLSFVKTMDESSDAEADTQSEDM